jgi:hypothetical protein
MVQSKCPLACLESACDLHYGFTSIKLYYAQSHTHAIPGAKRQPTLR